MQYYSGIGSRQTPDNICKQMVTFGKNMALKGLTLRSGHADGADKAFEYGCNIIGGPKEIYIPWKNFNQSTSHLYEIPEQAFLVAEQFHPAWNRLKQGAQKLMARNVCQVAGMDLNTPSLFVLCWTPNGSGSGGTGQALRIAKALKIPVFDLGKDDPEQISIDIMKLMEKFNEESGN